MEEREILIPVRIDSAAFQDFALFDIFRRRGTARRIVLFAGPLMIAACLCFVFSTAENQGALLGGVLLAVSLALPAVYLANFFVDIKKKATQMGLDQPKRVYTIRLNGQEVRFQPAGQGTGPTHQPAVTPWPEIYGAWRTKDAIYLYAAQNTAYLLPNGQARETSDEELWRFLGGHLAPEKLHDLVK